MSHYHSPETGQAHVALAYWRQIKQRLGRIVTVEMEDYLDADYPMTLRDDRGNVVKLAGVTSGYFGTGPRTAITILQEAGFTEEWVQAYCYGRRSWQLTRSAYLREAAKRRGWRCVGQERAVHGRRGKGSGAIRPYLLGQAEPGREASPLAD